MAKRKRKSRQKQVRFGGAIASALLISMFSLIAVAGLALMSFVFSPQLARLGLPAMPLILPVVIIVIGWLGVKYVMPLFIRLRCPKCSRKALRYDCKISLSFHCEHCGIEKATWFYVR